MKMLSIYSLLFLTIGCMQIPVELANNRIADCSHATIPASYKPDSVNSHTVTVFSVCEIYDFRQNLIQYGVSSLVTSNYDYDYSGNLLNSVYWNGTDRHGKVVDPGKYLIKVSIISIRDTFCECDEIFITH